MKKSIEERLLFVKSVGDVVKAIPKGFVLSYGDVASLAGWPSHARLVGKILADFGFDSDVPCHRVVNVSGRPAPHWLEQTPLLKSEGVTFNSGGCVDMKKHRWHPSEEI